MFDSLLSHLSDPHPSVQHTLLSHLLSLLCTLRSSPQQTRYSGEVVERVREEEVRVKLEVVERKGEERIRELARRCLEERRGVVG